MKKYFLNDPQGTGFEEFDTAEERDAAAADCISYYLDEGWDEEVTSVVAGEVTHQATQVDKVERPASLPLGKDGDDSEGRYWGQDWHYICNYELLPIQSKQVK